MKLAKGLLIVVAILGALTGLWWLARSLGASAETLGELGIGGGLLALLGLGGAGLRRIRQPRPDVQPALDRIDEAAAHQVVEVRAEAVARAQEVERDAETIRTATEPADLDAAAARLRDDWGIPEWTPGAGPGGGGGGG